MQNAQINEKNQDICICGDKKFKKATEEIRQKEQKIIYLKNMVHFLIQKLENQSKSPPKIDYLDFLKN